MNQPERRWDSEKKEKAARDFVRNVLVSSFKQSADEATVSTVAHKVLVELDYSPALSPKGERD